MSQAFAPVFHAFSKPDEGDATSTGGTSAAKDRLPDISYPKFTVKHTFIDSPMDRPFSLDGFLPERTLHSCPTSVIDGEPMGCADHGEVTKAASDGIRACQRIAEGSASSRSTSVGSSSRRSSDGDSPGALDVTPTESESVGSNLPASAYPAHRLSTPITALPDIDYPLPFSIKNTFIHASIGRPLSMEEFYEERQLRSCPASGICASAGLAEDSIEPMMPVRRPAATGSEDLASVAAGLADAAPWRIMETSPGARAKGTLLSADLPPPPAEPPKVAALAQLPEDPPPVQAPGVLLMEARRSAAPVLLLSEATWRPALGSVELPTIGSEDHHLGKCSPCAHAYGPKGCQNGVQCPFCHLCPKGELKRRQQAKRLAKRRALDGGASEALMTHGDARAAGYLPASTRFPQC